MSYNFWFVYLACFKAAVINTCISTVLTLNMLYNWAFTHDFSHCICPRIPPLHCLKSHMLKTLHSDALGGCQTSRDLDGHFMFFFHALKQVPIFFSCLGEHSDAVLLGNSRNVLWKLYWLSISMDIGTADNELDIEFSVFFFSFKVTYYLFAAY